MSRDLSDRRISRDLSGHRAYQGGDPTHDLDTEDTGAAPGWHSGAWALLGIDPGREGRCDHEAAVRLAAAIVARLFGPAAPSRAAGGPSRRRADGFCPCARRDVEIYLVSEAGRLTAQEAAHLVGAELTPRCARKARAKGAAILPTLRPSKLNPDVVRGGEPRPHGKNERRW